MSTLDSSSSPWARSRKLPDPAAAYPNETNSSATTEAGGPQNAANVSRSRFKNYEKTIFRYDRRRLPDTSSRPSAIQALPVMGQIASSQLQAICDKRVREALCS